MSLSIAIKTTDCGTYYRASGCGQRIRINWNPKHTRLANHLEVCKALLDKLGKPNLPMVYGVYNQTTLMFVEVQENDA